MYTHRFVTTKDKMQTKIQKWGNSQGLRVPKDLLKEIDLELGNTVNVSVLNNAIVIRKLEEQKTPSLKELLSKIPKGYKYDYPDMFGDPVGKEVW